MGFDAENFGLGLLAGWGSAYAIYRARHLIRRTAQSANEGAKGAQNYATRSADSRYVNELVAQCESAHLAGEYIKLSEVMVEPRFIPASPLANLVDEDIAEDVYRIVPRIPDFPYLHAPYNIDTLSIDELAAGDRAIALLGVSGSGRTTALQAIALHSLNRVNFKPPVDKVQQKLDAEEARLTEKERATRIQERMLMEMRAKERLADERGVTYEAYADEVANVAVPLFKRLMPVYVHMADIVLGNEFGPEVDPAEPLVRAVQYRLGRVAASSIPRHLYGRLNKGQVLLLIDGYDDLPETEQAQLRPWLAALLEQYRTNFFIVAGPAHGYGALTGLGLAPVFLRPWSDLDTDRSAERWADVWPRLSRGRRRSGQRPDQAAVDRAKVGNRALPAMEIVLKLWANYADDVEVSGPEGWLRAYLTRHLPSDQQTPALLAQIAQIAALQLDEGFISSARLQALRIGGAAPAETPTPASAKKQDKEEEDSEATSVQGKLLGTLRRAGLLIRYRGDRYQFRHPLLAAYLASLTLKDVREDELAQRAMSPAWSPAIGYAAMHRSIDAAVQARMSAPPDILHTHVLETAHWLAYAPPDVSWRATLLKYLGNLMTAASQYPLVRERAAAALVSTRDRNIGLIFRRAVRTANPDVRRLACLGIGAAGDTDGIRDLVPLLNDQDGDVQLSAAMALGAIRNEQALEAMLIAFTEGTEQVRQAVAIALASLPEEGYPILHEAIDDPEMMIRRAAVFGLRRIGTAWALIAIYRAFLEDEQWYVRSAAQQAFQELQFGREMVGTHAPPSAEALPWLAEWAASRGENLPSGEGANQMLLKALQEGEPEVRMLSAAALGQLGQVTTLRPLYAALRDRQEQVRATAHRALAELQMQLGRGLPAPV